jgi:hypothetical protein
MIPSAATCPNCARPYSAAQGFCAFCGAPLGTPGVPGPPSPPGVAGPWAGPPPSVPRSPDQTITGLLLMIIAFGLAWIPFVDFVGGILALIGLIYLWNGRRELGPAHSAEVKVGMILLLVAIVVGIVGALVLVAATFSFQINLNGTQPLVTHPPVSLALEVAVALALSAASALGAACFVKLPYSLGDPSTRNLLLLGGALEIAFGALYAVSEVQALAAVSSFFSTGTSSSGPLPSPLLLGLLLAVPELIFLFAYYRVRKRLLEGYLPSASAGLTPTP